MLEAGAVTVRKVIEAIQSGILRALLDGLWPLVGKSLFFAPVDGRFIGRGRADSLDELTPLDTTLRGPAPGARLNLIRLRGDVSKVDAQVREASGEDHCVFAVAL